ncbi:MAG: hypothetical protein IPL61_25505 [Myxococcales bacterium]|nr:hypothetical protein [Myxococcales bacterium]
MSAPAIDQAAAAPPPPNVLDLPCGACQRVTVHQRRPDGLLVCVPCRVRAEAPAWPHPSSAMPPVAPARSPTTAVAPMLLVGGILAAVSVFLPWISLGALSRSGMELGDGGDPAIILVLAGVAVVLSLRAPLGGGRRFFAFLVGLAILVIAGIDFQEIKERVDGLADSPLAGAASVGSGLYVAIVGGALAAIGGGTGK